MCYGFRVKVNDEQGEEDVISHEIDIIFYFHRAKLYRFMSSVYEWKGKDLGDAKFLNKRGKTWRNDRTRIDHRHGRRQYEEAGWFSD